MYLTATATGMEAVTAAMSTVTTLVGNVFEMITSNALLAVFCAAGLIGVGIGVYKKVKRAAH